MKNYVPTAKAVFKNKASKSKVKNKMSFLKRLKVKLNVN